MRKPAKPFEGKLHIKKGDIVVVLSGKDRGKTGKVTRVLPKVGKVELEAFPAAEYPKGHPAEGQAVKLNDAIKHTKGQPTPTNPNPEGGRVVIALPISVSKVALQNGEGKPTRVRIQADEDGTKKRVAVKGGQPIAEPEK